MIRRIYEWARSQPTKAAFINEDEFYSYARFAREIEAARRFIQRQQLPVGGKAVILSESPGRTWILVMAIRALGLDTIAVQSLLQTEAMQLKAVACIVVSQATQNAAKLNDPLTATKVVVVPNTIFSNSCITDLPDYPSTAPSLGGHILFTSGTTGSYKKLLLPGDQEDQRNAARAKSYLLSNNTIYHGSNFGLWTTLGFRMSAAVWHVGGCVVFEGRNQPFRRFFNHRIDFSILTPSMLKDLLDTVQVFENKTDFKLSIAAGFLPLGLAKKAASTITNKIGIGFGSSELTTPAMLTGYSSFTYWLTPLADRTVHVVDENDRECGSGQNGELRVRLNETDCTCYLDDAETSAKVFRNGFFYPGDMAVKRADGRVRILGRTVDVLNVQGTKVAVAPIEQAVQHLLGVDEVCVFSGLNDAGQEQLVIAVQSNKELPRSELDAVARRFPSFERIRFAVFKEFPRTSTGTQKTQRALLRKAIFPEPNA